MPARSRKAYHLRQISLLIHQPFILKLLFPQEKQMMRAVICKGDPTSHGGKVLEGNANVTTNGRQVAQRDT